MTGAISGVSSMATRGILEELTRQYQVQTGLAVDCRAMGGVDAAKLVRAGEPLDIVILARAALAKLEAAQLIAAGSIRDFARSSIAVAAPAGGEQLDIATEDSVRRAFAAARRVAYSTGPSGDHLLALWRRWDFPDGETRLVQAPPGVPVADLLAQGDADIGIQQLSEFLGAPGIEIVGALPAEIQSVTVFAAGVGANSRNPGPAAHFIEFLCSPDTADAKRAGGMTPASA